MNFAGDYGFEYDPLHKMVIDLRLLPDAKEITDQATIVKIDFRAFYQGLIAWILMKFMKASKPEIRFIWRTSFSM